MEYAKIKLICLLVCFCCLTGCALVRMSGRVATAAGGEMVKSADEEEAKEESKKNSVGAKPSSQSMTVLQIQQRLVALGYNPGPADGIMGKSTSGALKKFQQDNNLSITGHADSETIAKLRQKTGREVKPPSTQHPPPDEKPKPPTPSKTSSPTDL